MTVEKQQRAVVAYIRNEEGKLLSIRTATRSNSAPGDKIEPCDGGSPFRALQREVEEETGLCIFGAKLVYEGLHESGRRVTAFLVESDCYIGEPVAREEGSILVWVEPEDIANGFGAAFHRKALTAAGIL